MKIQLIGMVILLGLSVQSHAISVKSHRPGITIDGFQYDVVSAFERQGRIYATLFRHPGGNEFKTLNNLYGANDIVLPVILDTSWSVKLKGEPLYTEMYNLGPRFRDVGDEYAVRMPVLLVRDPAAGRCPYLFGFPTRLICLDTFLQFEQPKKGESSITLYPGFQERRVHGYSLPVPTAGYLQKGKTIYVKSMWKDYLIHRLSVKNTGQNVTFEESLVPISLIRDYLKRTSRAELSHTIYKDETIPDIETVWKKREKCLKTGKCKPFYSHVFQLAYHLKVQSLPFQYDIDVDETKGIAYLALRNPLTVLVVDFHRNAIIDEVPLFTRFPEGYKHYRRLFLHQVIRFRNRLYIAYQVTTPMTFAEYYRVHPKMSEHFAQYWRKSSGQDIRPDTIVGNKITILVFRCIIGEKAKIDRLMIFDVLDRSSKYEMVFLIGGFYPLKNGLYVNGSIRKDDPAEPALLQLE